ARRAGAARRNGGGRGRVGPAALRPWGPRRGGAARAPTSQDLGLTHWKAAAPASPTGWPVAPGLERRAVATFHATQQRTAAPPHLTAVTMAGGPRITLPSPKATRNIIDAIPRPTPPRHRGPPRTPTRAP